MLKIRRWLNNRRKVVWSEPELPAFVKINPESPPGAAEGLQPGDITMTKIAEQFLDTDELSTTVDRVSDTAPITVVVGEEEFLVDRTVRELAAAARSASDPPPDVHDSLGADLAAGEFTALTSPSLFGGGSVVVIRGAQNAVKDVAAEITRYAAGPDPEVTLIMTHAGGAKGKALLTDMTKAGAQVITCQKLTRFSERVDFIRGEFRRGGRQVTEDAVRALLDAVGSDLRELSAACGQLMNDMEGRITEQLVSRYYRGRAEATGFTVADKAVEGQLADALEQLRWALSAGVSPVLICSALAQGVRMLGRVGAAPRGASAATLAAQVGAPPWKIDRVRRQLRGWQPDGVARALRAVAEADAQVKGESVSADYALERAIRRVVGARQA
jgi:DNA polymerase III subunit delta